jgi:hypothetical protein
MDYVTTISSSITYINTKNINNKEKNAESLLIVCISIFCTLCSICIVIATYANYREYVRRKNNKPYKKIIYNTNNDSTTENEDNISCSICLDNFEIGSIICELKCKHYYHKECIDEWLNENNTCPNCRNNVYITNHIRTNLSFQESIV